MTEIFDGLSVTEESIPEDRNVVHLLASAHII